MAGLSLHQPLPFVFGILGNIISFLVFLSPIPTFYRIYRKKSTEGFQSVPYVVSLFSCLLWIYYAFVKTDTVLLITINSFGCFIEMVYITLYLVYAPKKAKIFAVQIFVLLNVISFGLIVLLTQLATRGSRRLTLLGWICVAFSVSVFAAPLSIIRLVIRTRSVEFMPFYLSFFLTLSAIAWFGYGLFTKDLYVQLPNVLGFAFGVFQMLLYIIYKKKGADAAKLKARNTNGDQLTSATQFVNEEKKETQVNDMAINDEMTGDEEEKKLDNYSCPV